MSLFKFYSYIDESLHVSSLQAHPQENSHSCSHNHWFSGCTVRAACSVYRIHTAVHTTIGSVAVAFGQRALYTEFTQLFTQPLVQWL
jgi:hypothetical protein